MQPRARSVLCWTFLLPGCASTSGPESAPRVAIGVIDLGGTLDSVLAGPRTGSVGERLTFRVRTFGDGCVSAAGSQQIVQGLQITIIPYDQITTAPCTRELRAIPRDVTVVFDRAGDAFLRVQGRSYLGRDLVIVTQQMPILP